MKKIGIGLLFLLAALLLAASDWEWQFAVGQWTLQPLTSPVERLAEKVVADEARELLAPLLGDFTAISIQPEVDLRSRGNFVSVGLWRRLAAGHFAVGLSASYIRFSLPFLLQDEQAIYFQGIPVATITTRGEGCIELRTFMLAMQGRWRAYQRGRIVLFASLGLALLRFRGDMHLPLTARLVSILGDAELSQTEDMTLDELREKNDGVPAWSLSPAAGASLHYRLGRKSRLFIEFNLSQGTFLAAGISLDL
jgi:hypothetical protein